MFSFSRSLAWRLLVRLSSLDVVGGVRVRGGSDEGRVGLRNWSLPSFREEDEEEEEEEDGECAEMCPV